MLARRIIPCLDVAGGRVVKGVHFESLRDAGDPVEQAARYDAEGADELVFLDISASPEARRTTLEMVARVAESIFIPFTVGGGIRSVTDAGAALRAGADKVAVNTAAVRDPSLVSRLAESFGSQCVVAAVDVKRAGDRLTVVVNGGREETPLEAVEWSRRLESLGAGEILLTSMDRDGTGSGYDLALLRAAPRPSRCRSSPRVGRGTLPTWPRRSRRVRTACWPPRSFTFRTPAFRRLVLISGSGAIRFDHDSRSFSACFRSRRRTGSPMRRPACGRAVPALRCRARCGSARADTESPTRASAASSSPPSSGTRIDLTGVVLESGDSVAARYVGVGIASRGVDGVSVLGGTVRGYRFGVRLEGGRGHRVTGVDASGSRAQALRCHGRGTRHRRPAGHRAARSLPELWRRDPASRERSGRASPESPPAGPRTVSRWWRCATAMSPTTT